MCRCPDGYGGVDCEAVSPRVQGEEREGIAGGVGTRDSGPGLCARQPRPKAATNEGLLCILFARKSDDLLKCR